MTERDRLYLDEKTVQRALDRAHLTHGEFAAQIGTTRSYWSQLFRGHRHLTPKMRRTLLGSVVFGDVPEGVMWGVR